MDLLQIAIIFLIILLSIFLTITGIQVFLILRDLKKALDKFNGVLQTGKNIISDIGKPITVASNMISKVNKLPSGTVKRKSSRLSGFSHKRFYKKIL